LWSIAGGVETPLLAELITAFDGWDQVQADLNKLQTL
jgi:hypothetical protein